MTDIVTPRLGDSDADIEIVARIIAENVDAANCRSEITDGILDAARAIIELIRDGGKLGGSPES
jgi:hypothetical protein